MGASGREVGPQLRQQFGFLDEIQRAIDLDRTHPGGIPIHEDRADDAAPSVVLADFVAKLELVHSHTLRKEPVLRIQPDLLPGAENVNDTLTMRALTGGDAKKFKNRLIYGKAKPEPVQNVKSGVSLVRKVQSSGTLTLKMTSSGRLIVNPRS